MSHREIVFIDHNLLTKIEIKPTKKWATAHNFHPIHRYSSRNLSIFLRDLTVHQSKPYVHLTAESHHHGLIIILHVVCASFAECKTTRPIHPPLPSSSHEEGSRNFRWNGEFEVAPSVPRDGSFFHRSRPTLVSWRRIVPPYSFDRDISYRNKFVRIFGWYRDRYCTSS